MATGLGLPPRRLALGEMARVGHYSLFNRTARLRVVLLGNETPKKTATKLSDRRLEANSIDGLIYLFLLFLLG